MLRSMLDSICSVEVKVYISGMHFGTLCFSIAGPTILGNHFKFTMKA